MIIIEWISGFVLTYFSGFDLLVLFLDFIVFCFAGALMKLYPHKLDYKSLLARVWMIRITTIMLMFAYVPALLIKPEVAHQISQTALAAFACFLAIHLGQAWSTKNHGRVREVDGQEVRSDTITSESFNIIIFFICSALTLLLVLNIWELNSWLQATSVLGGLLIAVFTTKDYWLGDIIAGFMLLKNEKIESGAVLKVESMNILGVIKAISLTQTTIKDLVHKHEIILANSLLMDCKMEVLTSSTERGLPDYVDFNIGYGATVAEVEDFLNRVWERAAKEMSAINEEVKPRIHVIENGNHAVTWRIFYNIRNVFNLISARHCINKVAYDLSLDESFSLATPVTHQEVVENKGFVLPKPRRLI